MQLMAAAKVRIIRHVKIRSDVNPYDPKWELYLESTGLATGPNAGRSQSDRILMERATRTMRGLRPTTANSRGRLANPRSNLRSRGGSDTADNVQLLHVNCHRQIHVQERRTKAAASREGRS